MPNPFNFKASVENKTSSAQFMSIRRTFIELELPLLYTVPINPLTPNDYYSSRTAPLTSKRCILYIYSTNTGTEYFKHGIYSPFFLSSKCSLFHNSKVFGSSFIHILYTGVLKFKKNNSGAKGLIERKMTLKLRSMHIIP